MLCFNENTFPTSERENAVKYREQHFFYYERKTTDGKSSQWNVGCQFSSSLFKMHTLQTQLENEKSSFHMPMWGYIYSHFIYHMTAVLVVQTRTCEHVTFGSHLRSSLWPFPCLEKAHLNSSVKTMSPSELSSVGMMLHFVISTNKEVKV